MAANTSIVALCNRALAAVGGKAFIQNINENSAQANACNLLFSPTFQQLGRAARWNCLERQQTLSLLLAAADTPENPTGTAPFPPQPWLYSYLAPSDMLRAHYVLPTFPAQNDGSVPNTTQSIAAPIWINGMGQIPFKVMYAQDTNNNPQTIIVTNTSQAVLNYTTDCENPSIWDSQFQAAFVATLAAFLVPALSMHIPLMQVQIGVAERMIAEARAADGNEGTSSQDNVPDWIRARSGGMDGFYSGYNLGCGWNNICWPAYGA